jgi:hypothetical protein
MTNSILARFSPIHVANNTSGPTLMPPAGIEPAHAVQEAMRGSGEVPANPRFPEGGKWACASDCAPGAAKSFYRCADA